MFQVQIHVPGALPPQVYADHSQNQKGKETKRSFTPLLSKPETSEFAY